MDVLRLNDSTFLPDSVVEGYSSMIWSERFAPAGDFQMKTPKIDQMRALIPEGSLVSLLDSKEVMQVETFSIDKDDNGVPEATIVGRSFETFTENRGFETSLRLVSNPKYFWRVLTTAEQALYFLWNDIVSNPTNTPNPNWIPNLVISSNVTKPENSAFQEVPDIGNVYAKVLDLIQQGGHGIRSIRPVSNDAVLISFDATGLPIQTQTAEVTALRLEIYDGVDRTRGQSENTPVVLSYDAGDITDPKYLFSIKDYKNIANVKVDPVAESFENRLFYIDGASELTTGLDRRVLSVDSTDIKYSSDPSYDTAVAQRAYSELAKHNNRLMFGSEVSPLAHYKYGTDYFLGDYVTVAAEYDFEQTMIVTEYIRTEDQAGDRGYPTLVLPS